MAVLPSPEDVGPIPDSPGRRTGIAGWNPRVISEDGHEAGAGFERLGADIGQVGIEDQQRQDALQMAQARGDAAAAVTNTLSTLPSVTDSSKLPAMQDSVAGAVSAAGARLNPYQRNLFDAEHESIIAQANAHITARGREIDNQNGVANFETTSTDTISKAASLDTDAAGVAALDPINKQIGDLVTAGALTPEQGVAYKRRAVEQFTTARRDYLYANAIKTGRQEDWQKYNDFLGLPPDMAGGAPGAVNPAAPTIQPGPVGPQPGMLAPGNIDLAHRPVAQNDDGTISTVRSISIGVDGKEVVIPTVIDGKVVSDEEAKAHYRKTGENLGTFDTVANAEAFATKLHDAQAAFYGPNGGRLAGQATPSTTAAVASAKGMLGKSEVVDQTAIEDYLKKGGQNLDPHSWAWCSAFVSSSLRQAGIAPPNVDHPGAAVGPGNYAPDYLTWGSAVAPGDLRQGDVLVANNGHHVGLAEGPTRMGPNGPEALMIAGNDPDPNSKDKPGQVILPSGQTLHRSQVGKVDETWVSLGDYQGRRGIPSGNAPTVSQVSLSPSGNVSVPANLAPMVTTAAQKWGVDPNLLSRQLHQESGFRDQTSSAGAQGIAQFMPATAEKYGVNVHDPQSSIEGQAHYMHDLLGMFGGNQGLALAGYNWGEGHVQAWLRNGADPSRLPRETANYVQSITGHPLSEWLTNPGIPIHTVPLGPGQTTQPPSTYPRIPVGPDLVASASPIMQPASYGVGGGSSLPMIGGGLPIAPPPMSEWPDGAQSVVQNGDGSMSYQMGDGSFVPIPESATPFGGGAPLGPIPKNSPLSLLPPDKAAEMRLQGVRENLMMQRQRAMMMRRDIRGDLASIDTMVSAMTKGTIPDPAAIANSDAVFSGPGVDPRVQYEWAQAKQIAGMLRPLQGQPPEQVSATAAAWRAQVEALRQKDPFNPALPGLDAVAKAGESYAQVYAQGLKKDPYAAAARDGVISYTPFDPSNAQAIAKRVSDRDAVAHHYGLQSVPILTADDRTTLRNISRQGGKPFVDAAKNIVAGAGAQAGEIFQEIGGTSPEFITIGQLALDQNVDHSDTIDRLAQRIADSNDKSKSKDLIYLTKSAINKAGLVDPMGTALSGMGAAFQATSLHAGRELAGDELTERNLDPSADPTTFHDQGQDILKRNYNLAVGAHYDNGVQFGGFHSALGYSWWRGRPGPSSGYQVLVPSDMKADQWDAVIDRLTDSDIAKAPSAPYSVGRNEPINADTIKNGQFVAVPNKRTGTFDGMYKVLLPDSKGEMAPVIDKQGNPWIFDLSGLAKDPGFRGRIPGAFTPSLGAPIAPRYRSTPGLIEPPAPVTVEPGSA